MWVSEHSRAGRPRAGKPQPPQSTPRLASRHWLMCDSERRAMGRPGRPSSTSSPGCSSAASASSAPTLPLPAERDVADMAGCCSEVGLKEQPLVALKRRQHSHAHWHPANKFISPARSCSACATHPCGHCGRPGGGPLPSARGRAAAPALRAPWRDAWASRACKCEGIVCGVL